MDDAIESTLPGSSKLGSDPEPARKGPAKGREGPSKRRSAIEQGPGLAERSETLLDPLQANVVNVQQSAVPISAVSTSILAPLAPLAVRALRSILRKPGRTGAKASDRIAAARLVLDRVEPATQRIDQRSVSVTVNLDEGQRAKYRKALGIPD